MTQHRKFGKRFLAGLCTLAMLVSSIGPGIQVAAESGGDSRKQMERDMEAAIKKALENEDPSIAEEHPKGIFSFATLQGEVNEENKDPLAVYLVRHGGAEGEQTVNIKFSDYSAEYGKDYYAKLSDSIFAEKVEANPDSVPLFYMFTDDSDGDGEQTAIDEESIIEAYGEERGRKIIELTKEYSEAEAKAQAKADDADAGTQEDSDAPAAKKSSNAETADNAKSEKKSSDTSQEEASSPLEQLIEDTSQYTDSGYSLTMEELLADDERNESTATYGANMLDTIFPGAETELVFEDGEVMKKIYVYPVDNEVADGDRVFNLQINGGSEDLAWQTGENSSTVTIVDDEQDEVSKISIRDCQDSVGTDGMASVTLQRTNGLYKISTVEFVVTAAEKELAKGTAIFMPDMTEKTVEFSVGDVDAKTVDNISFALQNPVGAKLSGSKSKKISLTELKVNKTATASGKDVNDKESPVGMSGRLSVNGLSLNMSNFVQDEKTGCKSIDYDIISESEMKLNIPDHGCSCKGARVAATLQKKINQDTVESVSIEFKRADEESSTCNRMYVAKQNKANGAKYSDWNKSQSLVLAASGDQDKSTMTVKFTDGSVSGLNHQESYKNEYMRYNEGKDDPYTPLTIASKKTSGGVNGMLLTVYSVQLNFRSYTINIQPAKELEGHAGDKPGELLLASTQTQGQNTTEVAKSTRYAYEKVNFKNYPDDYAYLDHLQFSDGTAIDAKYCEIGGTTVTLDMNEDFFKQYQKQIDSLNSKIDIQPVYAKKSVKLTVNTSQHGGIEVEGVKYPRGTKDKEITVHVGDKLKVKPYDVEQDYFFSSYEMIATGLNGKGDSKKTVYPAEEPDNMDIGNYNYTLEPTYTYDGTSVVIKADNIPEGCSIDKTEWTYKTDKIHARQILTIKATTGENYRAKWTITSNTHEWHGKTFYGDTLYHKIGGPTDEITLEFEQCTDMQYVSINGKALIQDATIKNKPFLNSKGVYLGNYVPVANASIQMGEFTGLTKQDGSYTLYSHTESEDTAGPTGTNTTTYLRAGSNETRTIKVIHNGLEQVHYLKITDNLSGAHSSQSNPYTVTNVPALELDFFGDGPTPYNVNTLLGTVDEDDFPSRLETSEQIEMRNYSVGFELTLADVLDDSGEDLIDKVNFYIYNKDNVFKTMHSVERTGHGQTTYTFDRYMMQDDEGRVGAMKLNGLIDFADQDKIYVELVGTMKDENGNKVDDADMSYGLYDTGIRFQEKLDIVEVQLKDVEPSGDGVPAVDVLGQMLPTVKLGKLGVSAVITSSSMEFSVGFDVKKLNTSIYDSWNNTEDTQAAETLKADIDAGNQIKAEKQQELEEAENQYKAKDAEIQEMQDILNDPENASDVDIARYSQLTEEMSALQESMNTLEEEISVYDQTIQEKQAEYDALDVSPENQKDPLEPAVAEEGEDGLDVTKEVTPEEITNVTEVTGPELNPLDKNGLWADMKNKLKNEAEKSGITKPKSNSLQGHGTISANLGIDIGVTVRFKTQVLNGGNAEWCFDKALVYAKVSGGVSAMYYFVIPNFPIPMYAGANFSASVGLYADIATVQQVTLNEMGEDDFKGDKLFFSGDIPVTLGIEGFVGMGLKSLLAIELGIGFLQKFDFAYTVSGDHVGTGMSSFYGYVQTNVLFFSFKWKFAQANWSYELYNTANDANKNIKQLMEDTGLGSDAALSEFTVENTPKVHYYGEAKARKLSKKQGASYSESGSAVLATGLSQTISDITPLGNGTYLMAFEGVRAEGDCPADMKPGSEDYDYNSRAIYLSYYDGTRWSAPVILQKDDTLDSGLQVEDMGDDILISWSSADHRFTKKEIATGEMTEDGQAIKADAAIKVLSSLDVYAAVLKKSEVASFVSASAEDREAKIDRLTKDQELTDAQRKTVEAELAEGAEYMGYGHENGQAVSVGDQIYLFYDTVDYNHWKNGEKSENLSDIVDAKGYILYKIYDRKTGKWMEDYAESADKATYEKLGFTLGQRMADIHLSVAGSNQKVLPMTSQMDVHAVKVKGEDRIALTYLVDSDGNSSATMNDQTLFMAFMKPAEVTDGAVKAEAEWSVPLQMNTELSHITNPQMVQTKIDEQDTVYLVWADDECLMYSNLTQLFQKVETETEEAGSSTPYTPIEVTTTELENGKKVEVYTLKDGIEPKIAILGTEENGFQYNNGYRLAADDKGHIYAVWAQSSGSAQGLYLSAMSMTDSEAGSTEVWSKPKALSWNEKTGGKYLTNPSIAVDSDGTILLGHNAYNLENVTTKDEKGNRILDSRKHADDTFCVTAAKAVGTPVLEDAELSNEYPRAGEEFTVTATAGNDGFLAAEKINVKAELVQTKDKKETVLDTQTLSFANVGSGHRDQASFTFTMKQEYLDAAKNDQAAYQVRLTASEKKAAVDGEYAETASAAVDIKTSAHYVFTNENVDGFRCRDITRDTEAGTIQFGEETGENRYMYSVTVMNDGNLPAEDMKIAMFASNENAFTSVRDKNGTYEGTAEELTEYYKTHSATESVVHNKNFSNWIGMKSFMADKVTSLGVGEAAKLNVLTAKIPDSMYSSLGGLDLMLAVYDNAAANNAVTKNEGMSTQPVAIVEEESTGLSLLSEGKKASSQTIDPGTTISLTTLVLPLKAAPDYDVLWESSNPQVAAVTNGEITGVAGGTSTIKASLMKDGKEVTSQSVDITVTGTPAASPSPDVSQAPQDSEKSQVTVSFKGNKGTVKGTAKKTVTIGEKYGTLPKATRKGYDFKGWYTKKSGGTKVTKNTTVTEKAAHSLYARWKKITVSKAKIKKLTIKKNGKLKVTVKPVNSADGYQIRYSVKKKFPKKTTKKTNTKKTKAIIKNLKKDKTLFVKVRAYKLDSAGKKVYGKYSKAKKKKA